MNEASWFVVGILVVLLLGQNVFWAKVCLNLTNRLMARDFQDFSHGTKIQKTKPESATPIKPLDDEVIDPESLRQASELNTMFGIA